MANSNNTNKNQKPGKIYIPVAVIVVLVALVWVGINVFFVDEPDYDYGNGNYDAAYGYGNYGYDTNYDYGNSYDTDYWYEAEGNINTNSEDEFADDNEQETDGSQEIIEEISDSQETLDATGNEDYSDEEPEAEYKTYCFRNATLLSDHYEKHGREMGFLSEDEYVRAANNVINHEDVLHKTEAEDGDDVYFIEETNEFVVVSTDGYIRTYYICSGKAYFDRQ